MLNLRRSIFITFLSTNGATAIQFIVTIILSRLLTPTEVGIFSITVVFIGIIGVFRDFGVSSYLQQEKVLTPEKAGAAFGLLLTTSWLIAGATYLCRQYIADFYGQPGIASVIAVLCISYAIVPFASFFYAVLARNLEAGKQAIVNGASVLAYSTTCLTLAYLGFSYMALAWANVVNIAATIIVYLIIRPKEIPCRPIFSGWSAPFRFGSGAIVGNLFNTANNAIPDLVLGKVSTAHDVGLYSRANGLVGIFQQIAGPTIGYNAVPFIAKNHHAAIPLAPILAKATSYLTGVAWPAFIMTGLFAEEIIRLLYGPQWIAAAPIASLIALQALIRYGYSLTPASLVAIGRPYLSALSSGISIIVRLGIIFALGTKSIIDFAIALCIADILTIIIPAYLMSKYLGYTVSISIKAHWPSIKLGLLCFIVVGMLKIAIPTTWPDWLTLLCLTIVVCFTWIIGVFLVRHPLQEELPALIKKILPVALENRILNLLKRLR